MVNAYLICDGQFGSTGKGLIAGYLAEISKPDCVITAWSPNAGHTYIDKDGNKFIHSMLANGIISPCLEKVMIGPGSQISIDLLKKEISECATYLKNKSIYIHENAIIIQPRHIEEEAVPMTKIGSTKKGVGAAIIDKIRRNPDVDITIKQLNKNKYENLLSLFDVADDLNIKIKIVSNFEYLELIIKSNLIQIEGAQGYSLGLHSGFYPYCTSRECTPSQIIIDTGVPPYIVTNIIASFRTFPIRVANRYDEKGDMIGWSGPCYDDQKEISFAELGLEQELSTVTKLPRRIFTFSEKQTKQFLIHCNPNEIFLNFCNYLADEKELENIISIIEKIIKNHNLQTKIKYFGFGSTFDDVFDSINLANKIFRKNHSLF